MPSRASQRRPSTTSALCCGRRASPHPMQAETIAEFAHAKWVSEDEWISASDLSPSYARILHSDARQALASGRGRRSAANIELRAFGANPHDPEIAAYLAYLYLRADPVQPETARRARAACNRRQRPATFHARRDWGVLAVASALTGREADATRALPRRGRTDQRSDATCRAALSAYSVLRRAASAHRSQAMLSRVHALGGAYAYPSCASPSFWANAARRPQPIELTIRNVARCKLRRRGCRSKSGGGDPDDSRRNPMSVDGDSRNAVTSATSAIWDSHVRKDGTPEGFTVQDDIPSQSERSGGDARALGARLCGVSRPTRTRATI